MSRLPPGEASRLLRLAERTCILLTVSPSLVFHESLTTSGHRAGWRVLTACISPGFLSPWTLCHRSVVKFQTSVLKADLASSAAGPTQSGLQAGWVSCLQNTCVLSCPSEKKNLSSHSMCCHHTPNYEKCHLKQCSKCLTFFFFFLYRSQKN